MKEKSKRIALSIFNMEKAYFLPRKSKRVLEAELCMMYALDDGDLLDYVDILSKVTYEEVTEMLHTAYKPEYYSLAIVKPLESEEK